MNLFATALHKVISAFLSLLILLFPGTFENLRQQRDNNFNDWAPVIVEAIKTENVEQLEDLMCLNIKQTTENLPEKIQELYECIEGEIIEYVVDKEPHGSSDNGVSKTEFGYGIYITTDKQKYYIGGVWRTTDTDNPEETRIRSITLSELNGDEEIVLYRIWNTAGHLE